MYEQLKKKNSQKLDEFNKELNFIKTLRIKNVVEIAICFLHPLFFVKEASSTGKYHPIYGAGKRGTLRHTKAAVFFANCLREIDILGLSEYDYDICIGALILHDSTKYGLRWDSDYTVHEHPLLVKDLIPEGTFMGDDLEIWNQITEAINTHMGKWTTSTHSTITLPSPKTPIQNFVHQCDYLASRKVIDVSIWNEIDMKIIEEEKIKEAEREKLESVEKMTDQQKEYIQKLVAEYKEVCKTINAECSKKYLYENFSFLNKKTAGGFIAGLKKEITTKKGFILKKDVE